ITGAFMVFMCYVAVFATQHGPALGSLATPLNSIAGTYNVPVFRGLVSIGAIISFFSLSLSCLNAGARIIFPLAGHGFLPKRVHAVHPKNMTPHMALAAYRAVILTVAIVLYATGWNALTLFGDAGTLAAFGFLTLGAIEASLERALEDSVHAAVLGGNEVSIDQPPAPAFAAARA
ncbi:MAG: hypothetical protein M3071_00745, partial [Actinomycetota bacterium]|nr:hypothetical protein [Actinomycetota bacterium]